MPTIEGLWVRNYRLLQQIALGSSFQQSVIPDDDSDLAPYELTPLTVLTGPGGLGKSTLLDVFAFLADCLKEGLDVALAKRGGFNAVCTQGSEGPISIGIVFRACSEPKPLTYAVNINQRRGSTNPYIESEVLVYRGVQHGVSSQPLLFFQNGDKTARHVMPWHGVTQTALDKIRRTDPKHLGLSEIGLIEDIPDAPSLLRHLESLHRACYRPDNAIGLSPPQFAAVPGERLSAELKRIEEKHRFEFGTMLQTIASRIPRMERIYIEKTESGRTYLFFKDKRFPTAFAAHQMSEGTLRLFSHLLLLEDSSPPPLVAIEEPDCYMGPELIESLARKIRTHTTEFGGTQFFLTTHNPILVDQMDPSEVWLFFEDASGVTRTCRAYDELVFQGIDINTIGPGWYGEYLYNKKT